MQPAATSPPVEIHSASTEQLTSEGLAHLRSLLAEAFQEREALKKELASATVESNAATARYDRWERGVVLRRVFKAAFAARRESAQVATAKLEELQEQLRLTVLATEIVVDREQAGPYSRMRDAFGNLATCQKIWNVLTSATVDRVVNRSKADTLVTRTPVSFSLSSCDLIQWDEKVPHLSNRTGGDMYIYPGFILYRAARQTFALIDFHDVNLVFAGTEFTESSIVPSDAEVIGKTWAKCNKDGTPDRRFQGNRQIPVAHYGSLSFTSADGLDVRYICSNRKLAEQFVRAWSLFRNSFGSQNRWA